MKRPVPVQDIGQRVRKLREARGWRQKELAERVGISRAAITQIESGKTKDPKRKSLLGIAQAFGVTIENLISDAPVQTPAYRSKQDARAQTRFRHNGLVPAPSRQPARARLLPATSSPLHLFFARRPPRLVRLIWYLM